LLLKNNSICAKAPVSDYWWNSAIGSLFLGSANGNKDMRKLLIGTIAVVAAGAAISNASAADLPMMTKAPALSPYYDWSGFYVGGEVGGGWFRTQTTVVQGNANFPSGMVLNAGKGSGVLGGGYAGYNYQVNRGLVVGIDGSYSGADLTGSVATVGPTGFTTSVNDKVGWLATVTGRVGFVVDNNFLIYVKGGWAWAGFSSNGVTTDSRGTPVTDTASKDTRDGATVGIGGEWGFAPNWSAKVEYDYVALNTSNFLLGNTSIATGLTTFPARSAGSTLNILKVGISYRFGPKLF
jgi:outer membrane immunogenic protein